MNIKHLMAVTLLAALGAAANAEVVRINFENLAAGSSVTSQYAALGAHFSTVPIVDPNGVLHNSVEVLSYPKGDFGTKAVGIWGAPIEIIFDSDVSNFSVLMNDTERGSLLGSVRAFDKNGRQMEYLNEMTGQYNTPWFYQMNLTLHISGIRSVLLMSDSDGAIIDNITYTRVPAPGAASFLCAGLLGAGRRRRL